MRITNICAWTEDWGELYSQEEGMLKGIFGDELVDIFHIGSEHIQAHLDFKEYLIRHPMDANRYGELKINLAKQFPNEHHKYQEGKQPFIHELVGKVQEWAKG